MKGRFLYRRLANRRNRARQKRYTPQCSHSAAPTTSDVIDLTRATVLPGLIDAHEHIFLTGEDNGRYDEQLLKESWQYHTIEATVNAKRDLDAGFTSMRDLETEGAMYSDVDVRNAINRGLIPGPRLEVVTRAFHHRRLPSRRLLARSARPFRRTNRRWTR